MLDLTDIGAEVTTLTTYVVGGSAIILGAYGVRYAFKAGWKTLKAALGITTSAASGK